MTKDCILKLYKLHFLSHLNTFFKLIFLGTYFNTLISNIQVNLCLHFSCIFHVYYPYNSPISWRVHWVADLTASDILRSGVRTMRIAIPVAPHWLDCHEASRAASNKMVCVLKKKKKKRWCAHAFPLII